MNSLTYALIRMGWRSFRGTVATCVLGLAGYLGLLMWIYPTIAHTPGLAVVIRALPKSLVSATGLEAGLGNPGAYLASEFFGTLYLWLLMILTVMGVIRLVAQGPARGTAGFWLAGPISRTTWVLTQGVVFWLGLFTVCGLVTIANILAVDVWDPHQKMALGRILTLNGMAFVIFAVLSGVIAIIASAMRDDRRATVVGSFVVLVLYILSAVSSLSPRLAWAGHLSLFYWDRPAVIVVGRQTFGWSQLILLVIAGGLWVLAAGIFRRRDLFL